MEGLKSTGEEPWEYLVWNKRELLSFFLVEARDWDIRRDVL